MASKFRERTELTLAMSGLVWVLAAAGEANDGYRVQLAAFRSEAMARAGWNQLVEAHPDLLGSSQPLIEREDLGPGRGIYYRLRVAGLASAREAEALCAGLRAAGGECFVVPPSSVVSTPVTGTAPARATYVESLPDEIELDLGEPETPEVPTGSFVDEVDEPVVPSSTPEESPITEATDLSPPDQADQPPFQVPLEKPRGDAPSSPRGLVEGLVGMTFETDSAAFGAAGVGVNVSPRVQIYGEFGYMRSVLPRSQEAFLESIEEAVPNVALDSTAPFFYGLGGVRIAFMVDGITQPYVIAGAGFATGHEERTLSILGQDFTRDFRITDESFIRSQERSGPLFAVRGGLSIVLDNGLSFDVGYGYQRLLVENLFNFDDPTNFSRVHFGVGYVFRQ